MLVSTSLHGDSSSCGIWKSPHDSAHVGIPDTCVSRVAQDDILLAILQGACYLPFLISFESASSLMRAGTSLGWIKETLSRPSRRLIIARHWSKLWLWSCAESAYSIDISMSDDSYTAFVFGWARMLIVVGVKPVKRNGSRKCRRKVYRRFFARSSISFVILFFDWSRNHLCCFYQFQLNIRIWTPLRGNI